VDAQQLTLIFVFVDDENASANGGRSVEAHDFLQFLRAEAHRGSDGRRLHEKVFGPIRLASVRQD
jgi:hypothetical protein